MSSVVIFGLKDPLPSADDVLYGQPLILIILLWINLIYYNIKLQELQILMYFFSNCDIFFDKMLNIYINYIFIWIIVKLGLNICCYFSRRHPSLLKSLDCLRFTGRRSSSSDSIVSGPHLSFLGQVLHINCPLST